MNAAGPSDNPEVIQVVVVEPIHGHFRDVRLVKYNNMCRLIVFAKRFVVRIVPSSGALIRA